MSILMLSACQTPYWSKITFLICPTNPFIKQISKNWQLLDENLVGINSILLNERVPVYLNVVQAAKLLIGLKALLIRPTIYIWLESFL